MAIFEVYTELVNNGEALRKAMPIQFEHFVKHVLDWAKGHGLDENQAEQMEILLLVPTPDEYGSLKSEA